MNEALLGVGLVGSCGMTFLAPLAARVLARRREESLASSEAFDVDVLIPAHNEERDLPSTLASVRASARGSARVRILVGADSCVDRTADVARAGGAEVFACTHRSKWRTLRDLSSRATAPVVAWVDAGTLWPGVLLARVFESWRPDWLGFAPAYRPSSGGLVSRALWAFEAALKTLENAAGGPVSVHGATVFYDRLALNAALDKLGEREWRNDDVAVPYTLRCLFPERRLVYSTDLAVDDRGLGRARSDGVRRLRMVEGNLEVLRLAARRQLPLAREPLLLLSRRAFRLLWAWWALCLLAGFGGAAWASGAVLGAALFRRRSLGAAFLASLAAPVLFFFPRIGRSLAWT
jgi:glycosyltransferase involved in cell wall biosynthesis